MDTVFLLKPKNPNLTATDSSYLILSTDFYKEINIETENVIRTQLLFLTC